MDLPNDCKLYTLTRVVIGERGTAVTPDRARELGIPIDVILVREDGWTLGAPKHLADVARRMFRADWIIQITVEHL